MTKIKTDNAPDKELQIKQLQKMRKKTVERMQEENYLKQT